MHFPTSAFFKIYLSKYGLHVRCNIRDLLSYGAANLPESENSLRVAFDVAHQAFHTGEGEEPSPWQVR